MSSANVSGLIKFPGCLPVLVSKRYDCSGHTLSFESETARLDVKLLINMHGQLTSSLPWCLCSVHSHSFFICLTEVLHLLLLIL